MFLVENNETEKLLRDILKCFDHGLDIQPNSAYHREIKKLIAEIDANPPRVEGDMERQRDAYAKAMAVALKDGVFPNKVATKKKIEDLLRATLLP